jgi:hypothetical protein
MLVAVAIDEERTLEGIAAKNSATNPRRDVRCAEPNRHPSAAQRK